MIAGAATRSGPPPAPRPASADLRQSPKDDPFHGFSAVAFSPDGKSFVASGADDDEIRFYDPVTHRPAGGPLPPEGAQIIVFSPDGRMLASTNDDVQIWDVAGRKQRTEPSLDIFGGQHLTFSPDGATIAVDDDSEKVRFLAAATGEEHGRPLNGHIGSVTGLAYSTDGRTIVTSDWSGLHFWDATTHRKRATATIPGTPPIVEKLPGGTITHSGTRAHLPIRPEPRRAHRGHHRRP